MIDRDVIERVTKQNEEYCKHHKTSIQTEAFHLSDYEVENLWLSYIAEQALTLDEYKALVIKTEADPELAEILRKVFLARSEFKGGGLVKGFPRREIDGLIVQDDEVCARLQNNCFIFRAKAVEQIGADVLQRMMENAEKDYNAREKLKGWSDT